MRKYKLIAFFGAAVILTICFFLLKQDGQKVITVGIFAGSNWDVPNGESYRIIDNAIERFEKLNPNIKVEYRSGTLKEDYSEWLAQKILTGSAPDIFVVLAEDFVTLASIGALKNLDELIKNDEGFDKSAIYTTALQAGEYGGDQYALPFETVPILMFMNKTLLEKEHIPAPRNEWTWDDLYEICEKVTRDTDGDGTVDQFGVYEFHWQDSVYTNGVKLFNEQGNQAFFNSDYVFDAVMFAKKVNALSGNYRVTAEDYEKGSVAFRPLPFSSYRAYKPYPYRIKKDSGFEWDCIKMPAGENGDNASELYTLLYGISNRTRHEKEAWDFLKFLGGGDTETQLDIFRYSHGVSVMKSVTESEEASLIMQEDMGGNNFIDMKILSEVIEQAIVPPKFPRYSGAVELADKELYQAVHGEKSPDTTLSAVQREVSEYLKQ